jgi:hypothetical protein
MLTRRTFLKLAAMASAGVPGLAEAADDPRSVKSCRPVISGTLWWVSPHQSERWGRAGWLKELAEQKKAGFDLLWLTNASSLLGNDRFSLRQLLDVCGEAKMRTIVDTGMTGDWYRTLNLSGELELCTRNIRSIGELCSGHPAFHAWYIPQEIYMCWGPMDDYIQRLYPALVESCKKSASLPVTVSPFFILDRSGAFGDFQFNEPDQYRDFWAQLIRKSGMDVIMLQDSGEHFSYVTDEQRQPFFAAMSAACRKGGARLWGNVETAEMECESVEEYVRRFGRVHHSTAKGIRWRPVPLERLKTKLALAAQYSELLVSWGYQQFCRPGLGPEAASWYEAYGDYSRTVS